MSFRDFLDRILDLFFVTLCPVCRQPCGEEEICPACKKKLDEAFSPHDLYRREMIFDHAMSAFDFENPAVKSLVYCVKLNGWKNAVTVAGEAMYGVMYKQEAYQNADLITWIPRSAASVNRYGFDQAKLLAEYLSRRTGIPCRALILRKGKTRIQKRLNRAKRMENVKNVFSCSEKLHRKTVILVDDMITSAASVNEAAKVLKKAGCTRVRALSVASADKREEK